jgi:hypothetical protein
MARRELDLAMGLFGTYDDPRLETYAPRRLRLLWIENSPLDCRIWSYYCDIKAAMARLHELCTPRGSDTCVDRSDGRRETFVADAAVVGPRYSINVASDDEPLGFNRPAHARMPLLVLQNKMYTPQGWREIVGDLDAKLRWVRSAGAIAAFTWLSKYREFTRISGVPHHWLPFGVDPTRFGRHAGSLGVAVQQFDVGFTGASGADKYPLRRALLEALQAMNVTLFTGSWLQTALKRDDNHSWKAGTHEEYAQIMSRTKVWLSTTGPEFIVGTRYYEVLASGTTMLLCNRATNGAGAASSLSWQSAVYDGLFEDGVHAVFFDNVSDMRTKVSYYLNNELERRSIVRAAHARTLRLHTWDARARFVSWIAEEAIRRQANRTTPHYTREAILGKHGTAANETGSATVVGCYAFAQKVPATRTPVAWQEPPRSRNRRNLHRYTVQSCHTACTAFPRTADGYFGLHGGGFSNGNAHVLARCFCAERTCPRSRCLAEALPSHQCATSCSLHDARPCGGPAALAVYAVGGGVGMSIGASESVTTLPEIAHRRRSSTRGPWARRAPRRHGHGSAAARNGTARS